jgi:hypothetical protein
MSFLFEKFVDINFIPEQSIVCSQNFSWPRRPASVLFPGHDVSWARTVLAGHDRILPSALSLMTVRNGYFVIGDGYDGLILTSDLEGIKETAFFGNFAKYLDTESRTFSIPLDPMENMLDEVFIGYDATWTNYFHWLCFALTRTYFAARTISPSCRIVLPDYAAHVADRGGGSPRQRALPEIVWRQSLELSSLPDRISLLPPGIYHARKIHTVWPNTNVPTDILHSDVMHRAFSEIRTKLKRQTGPLNRIYVSRAASSDSRIDLITEQSLVVEIKKIGFQIVRLETLNFMEQANLFYNSEIVIAPHGAGLTNIVFGREDLRVLELNRKIPGDSGLRPWFYMIASMRGQKYGCIDGTEKGFSVDEVLAGVETLLEA